MSFSNRLYTIGAARNPAVQVLSILAVDIVLIGAVVLGAVILTFVFALAAIAAAAFSVRLWWLKRKIARRHAEALRMATGGRLIEAEYTVVTERSTRRMR